MYIKRITADNDDIDVKAFASLKGILLTAGSDAAAIALYDSLTVTGTDKFSIKAATGTSFFVPIPSDFGQNFKTGVSVDITGTSAVAYLYFE